MTVRIWRTIDGVAGGSTGRRGEGAARRRDQEDPQRPDVRRDSSPTTAPNCGAPDPEPGSDGPAPPRDSHIRALAKALDAALDAPDSLDTPKKSPRAPIAQPADAPPTASAEAREVLAEPGENSAAGRPEPPEDLLDDDGADAFDAAELRALSGYAKLAELLKDAHRVLRDMDLDVPDRADFVRRLLVITAAARHDQDDAMRRLELFLQTVDRWRRPSL